jgi:hypothetical protein
VWLILKEPDGFSGALGHAGPAFNTILGVDRTGFIFFELVNLTWADLGTVSTAVAFFFVDNRIHRDSKSQIPNPKSQTNHKVQYPMTKMISLKFGILFIEIYLLFGT